ncbi:Response regulator of zinc sigma-54-dependent two-component system [Cystobacter fuscus DSM 2262]|uniref:Response regulator of zinc sigma-54-dependent two-component system n=1 Tax=Cystobacter fuscus (strain ATCC 25194 / DSM 2262 / NBRC 100088 / M29) TaxID=1242864 RepID=S9PDL6_CYSF2|nr:sigma-54 dependent transcriptional regulator [Cystobacter fuscus]EPX61116.1 Response regulator of zinc sigma-54-dependent two-component system [Cystobacter fuscus DSM 2262]
MSGRVLLVDDDPSMVELLQTRLTRRGFSVTSVTQPEAAVPLVMEQPFDVVLTDLNMKGMSGTQLCERVVANLPDLPVVVVTAFGSMETAVAAIRAGAYDFITKPVEMDALVHTLTRAVQHSQLKGEVVRLKKVVTESQSLGGLLGSSPPMLKVYDLLTRVADSDTTIIIHGESGTGKELVARALHDKSRRASGPFVAVNCAAMPEALLESELFGHAKGAFTDAKTARAGLFAQAHGGTLLLDEVGEMPLGLQPKLLRALQERRVRPVGGNHEVPFDVRVVAATHRDLEGMVEEQRFREDLYYRLNVVQLELPPLRARGGDCLLLAQHFIEHFAARANKRVTGLGEAVAERLMSYSWPGNVRELRNCIERAVAVTLTERLAVDDLPEKIRAYRASQVVVASLDPSELTTLEEVERRYILRVMEEVKGNKSLAAQILGLDRKTLYRKLDRFKEGTGE